MSQPGSIFISHAQKSGKSMGKGRLTFLTLKKWLIFYAITMTPNDGQFCCHVFGVTICLSFPPYIAHLQYSLSRLTLFYIKVICDEKIITALCGEFIVETFGKI